MNSTKRPEVYQYQKALLKHIGGDINIAKTGKLIYPKSLEIHLGGIKTPCNLKCAHCEGALLDKKIHQNSTALLKTISLLRNKISYFVFSGAYSEPTLDTNLINYLGEIKKNNANFGIHTNGTLTKKLLKNILAIGDENDYISISLDACSEKSFQIIKNSKRKLFNKILENIKYIALNNKNKIQFRLTYLLSKYDTDKTGLYNFLDKLNKFSDSISSLRFSVPYLYYGLDIKTVKKIQKQQIVPLYKKAEQLINEYINKHNPIGLKIFVLPPSTQDINKLKKIKYCLFGYYQITLGADGYFYQCNAVASEKYKHLRLGELNENISLKGINNIIKKNQDLIFNPQTSCFAFGCRCDRPGMEFNLLGEKLL